MRALGEEWDRWARDGHDMARDVRKDPDLWRCSGCGATADRLNFTGLPDDSWMRLELADGSTASETRDFDTCREARELAAESLLRL